MADSKLTKHTKSRTSSKGAGPHTIAARLTRPHDTSPTPSTIWKILRRRGLIIEQPKKRPRSSYLRFEAELPNGIWQSDFTHWRLASGTGVEILTFLDDHSRPALSATAHNVTTGPIVLADFRDNVSKYGPPASTLTDNGLVFTTRVRGGRNAFENELNLLGIDQKNGRPNHPQTQGKSKVSPPGVSGDRVAGVSPLVRGVGSERSRRALARWG